MNYQNTDMNYELNKEYRNRQEASAEQARQARNAQAESKSGKSVNILRAISQIIISVK